jgi:hypothetical protein
VAIQGEACNRWHYRELQGLACSERILQREAIDYEETFTPISRSSIRSIMSLARVFGWHLYQMDVKTVFLNGLIEEEVYINQLRGFLRCMGERLMYAYIMG